MAARLHAATYELLVLLREFDGAGRLEQRLPVVCALAELADRHRFRRGAGEGACRAALAQLPRLSGAMQRGESPTPKVRALTRIATPDNEPGSWTSPTTGRPRTWSGWSEPGGAAIDVEEARRPSRAHLNRSVTTYVDDDGMVVSAGPAHARTGRGRAARARGRERAALSGVAARGAARVGRGGSHPGQRRADALGLLAECALANLDRGSAADRYQVVLHIERPNASEPAGRRCWSSATAACAFPRKRRGDFRATPPSSSCGRRVTASRSTSAGRRDDSHRHSARPRCAGRALPLPGMHCASLRRPPRRALGRWRCHVARQPDALVPAASPAAARRRLLRRDRQRGPGVVRPAGRATHRCRSPAAVELAANRAPIAGSAKSFLLGRDAV